MRELTKILLVNLILVITVVIVFDVAAFFFLSGHYVTRFEDYRRDQTPGVGGRPGYPNGYFVANAQRGFDIGANRVGTHTFKGYTYPIWSNSLGCFDNDHQIPESYIYFAGDSFTWGYTPFEEKFGTLVEQSSDFVIFKCGVTHTGQLHQFEKFVEIHERVGRTPRAVFVFYVPNDIANDFAHPHTTVIGGWQVDNVFLNENNELKKRSHEELVRRIDKKLSELRSEREAAERAGLWEKAKSKLEYYSLSANIVNFLLDQVLLLAGFSQSTDQETRGETTERLIYSLSTKKNGKLWYGDNPGASRNKNALISFNRYARDRSIDFVVVLLPTSMDPDRRNYYDELKDFLSQQQIRFIDLTPKFVDRGLKRKDLYWPLDGHFSPSGNRIVAEALLKEFPDIFLKTGNEMSRKR